jgi:hypothetical protein
MEKSKLSRLLSVGKQVRAWAENVAEKEQFPSDLCGLCARASAQLHKRLLMKNQSSEIVFVDDHVYVRLMLDDVQYVFDVTATQFNVALPKVLLRPKMLVTDTPWTFTPLKVYKTLEGAAKYTKSWGRHSISLDV